MAVAIHLQGFRTMGELGIPFVFHIVTNLAGLELLARAKKRDLAEAAEVAPPESASA